MKTQFARIAIATLLFIGCTTIGAEGVDGLACGRCGPIKELTQPEDKASAMRRLRDDFKNRIGAGEIQTCDPVLEQSFGEGFSAVAGACEVAFEGHRTAWLVCSDDGVGNFSASTGVRGVGSSLARLRDFIPNCVGG